jgi:phenylacetate-CoA ligase
MNESLLRFYCGLTPSARTLAATMWGTYLWSWRYGPETDRLVEEALEREHWSPAQWQQWRETRLGMVLHRAVTRVPFYRDAWSERRRKGDRRSHEVLAHWPILDKEELRVNPARFVADDCDIGKMLHEQTSGSTGKSIEVWWSRQTAREWYALFEARWRNWHGLSRHDRWAILGGQLVVPIETQRPPFWVKNLAMHQLYMSSYHLQPETYAAYVDALNEFKVKYLWGYTSSLVALAQGVLDAGITDLRLSAVITNAEPLPQHQRELLAAAFRCPVRETYGMSEIVTAAGECQADRLHIWPEVGIVESLAHEDPVASGDVGDLVCTGLVNMDMPLIRYSVGDRAALDDPGAQCSCGRTLPMLKFVEGRTDDTLYTATGRRIGSMDTVFTGRLLIREAQIVQETLTRILVRYVPAEGFSEETKKILRGRIRERIGNVEVEFEQLGKIPRSANGKMRCVICNLPQEVKMQFQGKSPRAGGAAQILGLLSLLLSETVMHILQPFWMLVTAGI